MSSGSDSDEDYKPGEPEQLSEEESADDETDHQFEKEQEFSKKRKAAQEIKVKKTKRSKKLEKETVDETIKEQTETSEQNLHPQDEKKREDDLWAMFLEGTDTKPKSTSKESDATKNTPINVDKTKDKSITKPEKQSKNDDEARAKRIFEFAGETIVVENNVIKEKIKAADSPATVSQLEGAPSRSRGSGLSSVLNQLNKKNKLSTLEKSKLDWSTYKKDEGIEEEIESHNKGKAGYLDRQDFLERADVRQYEIERDLRMNRRSNR